MGYEKDSTEKKDYAVDWSNHLADGETITSSVWSSTPSGLTHETPSIVGAVTTTWISSGTSGVEYRVANHVVTSEGREFDQAFIINVVGFAGSSDPGTPGPGGGSDVLTIVNGGTVTLDDTKVEGTLIGYRVKATTTFDGEGGTVDLEHGAYTFERTEDGWTYYASVGTALAPVIVEPPSSDVTDTFTAADGTAVVGRTPTGGSTPWALSTRGYYTGATTPTIVGNKIVGPSSGQVAAAIPLPAEGPYVAEFDYACNGGSFRLLLGTDASNWFCDVDGGGNVYLFKPGLTLDKSGSGQTTTGRVRLRVAAGEKTTVSINGTIVLTSTDNHTASWSSPVVQIGVEGPATIDNFLLTA